MTIAQPWHSDYPLRQQYCVIHIVYQIFKSIFCFYVKELTPSILQTQFLFNLYNLDCLYCFLGLTCVHLAALNGNVEILRYLLWYGADINAKVDPCLQTPSWPHVWTNLTAKCVVWRMEWVNSILRSQTLPQVLTKYLDYTKLIMTLF